MEVFKTFGSSLEIYATRVFISNVSYTKANTAARQVDWNQYHLTKNCDGTVNVSLLLGKEEADRLAAFVYCDQPGPTSELS